MVCENALKYILILSHMVMRNRNTPFVSSSPSSFFFQFTGHHKQFTPQISICSDFRVSWLITFHKSFPVSSHFSHISLHFYSPYSLLSTSFLPQSYPLALIHTIFSWKLFLLTALPDAVSYFVTFHPSFLLSFLPSVSTSGRSCGKENHAACRDRD